MAEKRLDILIGARDRATRVFGRINRAFSGFTKRLTSLPALAAGALGGVAIGAFAKRAVEAFAVQEKAVANLRQALIDSGDAGASSLSGFTAFASALQGVTTQGDEATIALGAYLSQLSGLTGGDLQQATTATLGLARATGQNAEVMGRAMLLALDGNFTMLNRYIPALREASDDTERMRLVTELAGKGLNQMQTDAQTTGGRIQQMKNAIGDTWEVIGEQLSPAIQSVTQLLRDAQPAIQEYVRNFGDGIQELIERGRKFSDSWSAEIAAASTTFRNFPLSIKLGALTAAAEVSEFVDETRRLFTQAGEHIGAFAVNAFEKVRTMFINMGTIAKNFATNFTDIIGAMFEAIRTGSLGPLADLGDALSEGVIKAINIPPDVVKREASALTKALATARDEAEAELLRRQEQRQRDREARARSGGSEDGIPSLGGLGGLPGGGAAGGGLGGAVGAGNRGTAAIELGQRFLGLAQTGKTNDLERQRTDATKKLVEQGREQLRTLSQLVAAMNGISGGGASTAAGIDLGFS